MEPHILEGGLGEDERGRVRFVNPFEFKDVKRFYMIENAPDRPIRGLHGHMEEAKYVFLPHGRALLVAVPIDHHETPSKDVKIHKFELNADQPKVVYIPPGYANGMKMYDPDTKIIFFSTKTLEEAKDDYFHFDHNYWGSEIWE
ncbi:MAG: dTDP-4-dehydrorhamnose 3,5-epimerase family protein [bacterium]|nr:dTDP-4-dehydrorhamnose 3,5-epimerase family protein [bacterium]